MSCNAVVGSTVSATTPLLLTGVCLGVLGGGGGGGWHKASVSGCLPVAAPIGLSPLLILTLCGPERVLVVSTELLDDLSCLTTPGSAVLETGCCPCRWGGGVAGVVGWPEVPCSACPRFLLWPLPTGRHRDFDECCPAAGRVSRNQTALATDLDHGGRRWCWEPQVSAWPPLMFPPPSPSMFSCHGGRVTFGDPEPTGPVLRFPTSAMERPSSNSAVWERLNAKPVSAGRGWDTSGGNSEQRHLVQDAGSPPSPPPWWMALDKVSLPQVRFTPSVYQPHLSNLT